MGAQRIYVETLIRADLDRVWELTQNTEQHPRWDLRFSSITPIDQLASGGYRFRYELRIPFHTIAGTGTSIGERSHPDGSRTSALRFTTADRLSPLGNGRGYWRYVPVDEGVLFITGYDYDPQWGRLADRIVRPFIGWMTAWSFDRLRIWAEATPGDPSAEPERWLLASVLAAWKADRPRASRCRRQPTHRQAADAPPSNLTTLEAP